MQQKFSFTSFTSVRLPSGHYILFPAWFDDAPSADHAKKGIDRVSIQLSDEANGAVVGSSLDIALSEDEFTGLEKSLRRGNLAKEPVEFFVATTDSDDVVEFQVAGRNVFTAS